MAATGLFASRAAFFKLTAGRGTPLVNAANGFFTGLAIKGCATWRAVVGAAHAAVGTPVGLVVRGKVLPAKISALPFAPHRYFRG
jgi:aminomethyltransferase